MISPIFTGQSEDRWGGGKRHSHMTHIALSLCDVCAPPKPKRARNSFTFNRPLSPSLPQQPPSQPFFRSIPPVVSEGSTCLRTREK